MSQAEKRAADARRNVLLHVKQTLELLSSLRDSMHSFRLVDEGNGVNDESVIIIESSLTALNEISNKLKFIVVRSDVAYTAMKEAYLAMQDVSAYVGQVVKKPSTSSKQIFIDPFRTLATNLQGSILAFVSTVNAVALSNLPNGNVLSMQYQLGLAHLHGLEGRPVNHAAAADCFRQAAEVGNTEAMVCLARCYIQGQGVDRSEQKGVEWLVRAANSNVCPHAQNELAMLIINNLKESNPFCVKEYCATLVDDSSVVRSLRRSQQLHLQEHTGSTAAGRRSGDEYGVEDAIKLLLSAASEGCADAKSSLGAVYEEAGDLEQAASWYEQASAEGCSRGTYLLGHLFLKGRLSASKTRTFALLRQAALGGQTEAYCSLGTCYEQGIGTEASIPLAIQNYRRSAALGSKVGMFSLGYLLVENAIEMRKQLKQMRPFLHNSEAAGSHRSLAAGGGALVVAHTPQDERFAYLSTEAEATLQEGIHWLRAASENHVKDAAFQLGRLYEQAIGVPEDSYAALANYKWAAYLGHTKAAFFAGNLLYAQAAVRNPRLFCEAAVYYHQAALGGIVEAMNSYAILLEDGRASEAGLRSLHLAAAWYYQACIERERLGKAHINLAMLLCNTPLSAFRTIQGDIVTLLDAKDFLLLYFESDAYTDEESRELMLQMVDSIDEHSRSALPLVEEVSQSLASLRRSVRAHDRPRSPAGSKVVAITEDDEEQPVDVKKVPLSLSSSGDRNYSSTTRVVRPFEEAHKLSRGPIQNQGRVYDSATHDSAPVDGPFASQPPQLDTAPPVHGSMAGSGHYRPGELYTTDGPVVPPSFVPRAVQFNAPSFKPDKPPPHTKPTSRPGPPLPADVPVRAASVPVLTSPRKGQAPPASHSQSTSAQLFGTADPQGQGQGQRPGQGTSMGTGTGQQYPPAPQPVQRTLSAPSALPAPAQSAEPRTTGVKPKPNKRFSENPHQQLPSEEGKSGQEGSSHGAPAGADSMRKSVEPTRRPSMWKTLKEATGVSKSVDASRSSTPHDRDQRMPATAAPPSSSSSSSSSTANAQANWGLVAASASGHGVHATAPAQGVFASEPRPASSPAKPPKPQAAAPQSALQPITSTVPFSPPHPVSASYQSQPPSSQVPIGAFSPPPTPLQPIHSAPTPATVTVEPPSHDPPQPSEPVPSPTSADHPTAARPVSQQLPPVVDAASISSAGSRHSAPGPLNSMLVAMKRSAHKKYLTKEGSSLPSPAAQRAATSTGTMDTAASELDEAQSARTEGRGDAAELGVLTQRGVPAAAASASEHQDSVVDFVDEPLHQQSFLHQYRQEHGGGTAMGRSRAYSDYDPVSDLSLSSRDIRY